MDCESIPRKSSAGKSNINTNHRRDHAYKMSKSVKGLVIFSILFASVTLFPSYAQTEITLKLDKRVFVVGESVTVSGLIQLSGTTVPVIVQVWNPNNEACMFQELGVSRDGSFVSDPVKLSGRVCSVPGTYSIVAFYGDQEGRITFELQAPAAITSSNGNGERLQTLLEIVKKSKQNVDNKIRDVKEEGIAIPEDIMEMYEGALEEVKKTEDAVAVDDSSSAKQHAKNALQAFKQIFSALVLLESEAEDKAAPVAAASSDLEKAEKVSELKQAIARAKEFKNRLSNIATTSSADGTIETNFAAFDKAIGEAERHLEEGNVDDAAKALAEANQILHDIQKSLMQQAKEKRQSKAEKFVERTIKHIDEMIEDAKALDLPQDVIDALENAKERLRAATSINEILSIAREINNEKKEYTEEKGKNFERAVSHLESKLQKVRDDVSQTGMSMDVFDRIQQMIEEAKTQWSSGNKESAMNMLEKAERTLSQIIELMQSVKRLMNELSNLETIAAELKEKAGDNQEALDAIDKAVTLINGSKNAVMGATSEQDIMIAKSMYEQARQLLEMARGMLGRPSVMPSETNDSDRLKKVAEALEQRAERLHEVAEKQQNEEALNIVIHAFDVIEKAKQMISEEHYGDAESLLKEANGLLNKAEILLKEGTNVSSKPNVVSDRSKEITQEIHKLEMMAAELMAKAGDNEDAHDHIKEAIGDLNDAKELVTKGELDQAKSKVDSAREHLRVAKQIIEKGNNGEEKRNDKNSEG